MNRHNELLVLSAFFILFVSGSALPEESKIKTTGQEIIAFRVLPFGLTDIKLLEGPFRPVTALSII